MNNKIELGQVFTPDYIVEQMLEMRKNSGRSLEPSCGDGAFLRRIPNCFGIEIDNRFQSPNLLNIDFFDYPISEKFDTIIGNPPYIRYRDIPAATRNKLSFELFDERSNLYLFFIEKSIQHLNDGGELIFITPRDFLKATSSIKLNQYIFEQGTITDFIDLGDRKVFKGFAPNVVIFRFEKGNYSRKTNDNDTFSFNNGQLLFTNSNHTLCFNDIFEVKVGAVSGRDTIFENDEFGNMDFVNSTTAKTGQTKRMIFNTLIPYLEQYKEELLNRKIIKFSEKNWWRWGRNHYISDEKRIYVNTKTRNKRPFFLHTCNNYDGSILAIFPKDQSLDIAELCDRLNNINWQELGFVCDGRFLFSQRSLANAMLPKDFLSFK